MSLVICVFFLNDEDCVVEIKLANVLKQFL